MTRNGLAGRLAVAVPAALLAGAYVSQYVFGLYPCEMCWWQRYAHFIALVPATIALFVRNPSARRSIVRIAGVTLIVAGLFGGYHAGIEYGWWEGMTSCSSTAISGDPLDAIMGSPVTRCDVAPWSLLGISLAGWNFLVSTVSGIAVLVLSAPAARPRVGKA